MGKKAQDYLKQHLRPRLGATLPAVKAQMKVHHGHPNGLAKGSKVTLPWGAEGVVLADASLGELAAVEYEARRPITLRPEEILLRNDDDPTPGKIMGYASFRVQDIDKVFDGEFARVLEDDSIIDKFAALRQVVLTKSNWEEGPENDPWMKHLDDFRREGLI